MTKFRPCIDLHDGQVKQIVGGTLTDEKDQTPKTNFVSEQTPAFYANLYHENDLTGSHVIKLGPGNDDAAREALKAWPNGLQLGGGITLDNARYWLDAGAEKLIVTSWLFANDVFQEDRLQSLCDLVGKDKLVVDLSCRKVQGKAGWFVGKSDLYASVLVSVLACTHDTSDKIDWYNIAIKRWQVVTDLEISKATLERLANYCSEFLIHAADVEGLSQGIDEDLVRVLGDWSPIPCTYAGGAKALDDLDKVKELSNGRVDLTIGSALDIFGGRVKFSECVEWSRQQQ
eukprot:TRINITY_DN9448_c0_g1_i1.p1 TRINITY_DN9448_c0_g1~~TRINITY_DN9448_c0_g1_i1.p1  ORF type:complete len:287 (+),score=55.83 TRINITY_DN9448_c0_g1_i1:96-956(+)